MDEDLYDRLADRLDDIRQALTDLHVEVRNLAREVRHRVVEDKSSETARYPTWEKEQ